MHNYSFGFSPGEISCVAFSVFSWQNGSQSFIVFGFLCKIINFFAFLCVTLHICYATIGSITKTVEQERRCNHEKEGY